MHSAIVSKLQSLLTKGIGSEAEAVYFLVETRKLLEQQNAKDQYRYLTFHCDWAVHSELRGPTAQKVLKLFDEAAIHLRSGSRLSDLPVELRNEIETISKMSVFEKQLDEFLRRNQLPSLEVARDDGWSLDKNEGVVKARFS